MSSNVMAGTIKRRQHLKREATDREPNEIIDMIGTP